MKRTLTIYFLCISTSLLSMDPATAKYYCDVLKGEPLGFLPNRGTAEIRSHLVKDAQEKYNTLTKGWKSHCSSPLKPFESCTWYDIEAAWNGDISKLVCQHIPNPAKY